MNYAEIMSEERTFSALINGILLICFMTGLFFTWFFIHKARAKERLLMIEKGIDISNISNGGKFNFSIPLLKIGFVLAGASIGAALGEVLHNIKIDGLTGPLLFAGAGIGMILGFLKNKSKDQK